MEVRWTLGSYWGMLMRSLAWLECVSTSWRIKWLMPSVGRLFPWPGFNVALCMTVATPESHTDWPGTDWFLNPGLGGDPQERIHQIIGSMPRWCREYTQAWGHTPCVRQMSCWGNWVWFWHQSSVTFVQGHPYSFSIIVCYVPGFHILCMCI